MYFVYTNEFIQKRPNSSASDRSYVHFSLTHCINIFRTFSSSYHTLGTEIITKLENSIKIEADIK